MPSGYYLVTDSPPNIREFPTAERFESTALSRAVSGLTQRRRTRIKHETEEGAFWVYPQANRRHWRLVFRVTETDLEFFYDLDEEVGGDEDAFYFVPEIDASPELAFLVRKQQDFDTPPIGTPTYVSGEIVQIYDYVLELLEESEAGQILA